MMNLKVTIALNEEQKFKLRSHSDCEALNPKELLLYSAALCAGMTLQFVLKKERLSIKGLELTVEGELSTETVKAESVFTCFEVIYRLECETIEEQEKCAYAVKLAHNEWCGLVKMLRRIAPVTHEISIVAIG